jgi:hypothetical protein
MIIRLPVISNLAEQLIPGRPQGQSISKYYVVSKVVQACPWLTCCGSKVSHTFLRLVHNQITIMLETAFVMVQSGSI